MTALERPTEQHTGIGQDIGGLTLEKDKDGLIIGGMTLYRGASEESAKLAKDAAALRYSRFRAQMDFVDELTCPPELVR